ncbi:MAG: hypothetical protein ABSA49_19150 [Rhizomicrobium sp.]|jgi:hypothetical protein
MTAVRRIFIVLLVLVIPPLLTVAMYVGTEHVLAATNYTIDPRILTFAAYSELAAFAFVAILEARDRW